MSMRVLIVNDYGTRSGGAEHMSLALRDGLRQRGHEAWFFSTWARDGALPIEADRTCFGTSTRARRVLQVANPAAPLALRRALADLRPDVVHVRMFLTQLSPLILPVLRHVPALLHVVNYDLICPRNTKMLPDGAPCHQLAGAACRTSGCLSPAGAAGAALRTAMQRWWMDAFDLVVANSTWTARRLRRDGVHVDEVVWNGVPLRPARTPVRGAPTAAYVGRLLPKKGVDVLLTAMARVRAAQPDARLLVVGDGSDRRRLERLAADLEITEAVTFLGHRSRSDMESIVESAWVQAVPSVWEEPFGLVTAEALMRGTAVVASETGGSSELVEDHGTGRLVPPGDAGALADALLGILQNRAEAERMGREGRRFATSRLTEACVLDRFEALYHRLLIPHTEPMSALP